MIKRLNNCKKYKDLMSKFLVLQRKKMRIKKKNWKKLMDQKRISKKKWTV